MHTEVFSIYECGERHGVEKFHENLVSFLIIPSDNFFSEGETLGHVPGLVVTSEHDASFLEVQLDAAEEEDGLHAVDTSVNVVAQEKVTFS